MKKICLLLVLCVTLACFCGCREKDPQEQTGENPYATATNLTENGYFFLGDFETAEQCAQVMIFGNFGKISLNTDKTYVTHGEGSLKMEVLGREETWGKSQPAMRIACTGEYFQKTDFSDCVSFCFDLYNSLDERRNVDFRPYLEWETSNTLWMEPGWNHVELEIADINYSHDNPNVSQEFRYISLVFPRGEDFENQVWYLDNFRARLKES